MTGAALILCAATGAFFEMHSIPLNTQPGQKGPTEAQVFFANADSDGVADLFVLEAKLLSEHSHTGDLHETILPEDVSVFDVADIDKDGSYEIVAIEGRRIVRIPLALQGDRPEPVVLFEAGSLWAETTDGPVPRVLVDEYEGAPAIALSTMDGTEYRRTDGAVAGTVPYGGKEAYVWANSVDLGRPGLTLRCTENVSLDLYNETPSLEGSYYQSSSATGLTTGLRNAANEQPTNWPWFLVHREPGTDSRAYCAVDDSMVTVVRTCDVAIDPEGFPSSVAMPGPARRYPGVLTTSATDFPDFNGDGYKDLLLWKAPVPGISVDAILRAVVGRDWPITLTAHLYSPSKGRFEPEPTTELSFRIPVTWFLNGSSPLRNPVFADFNGDKKCDLGMCTEEKKFSVWLFSDGFAATPDETHTFTENITGVELAWDVAGNGKTSVVLRSDHYVYALYAK